jgi:SAM-dependent methyltransferase
MPGSIVAFDDPDDYRRVRDVFRAGGYTDEGVVNVLGFDSLARHGPKRLPALLRRSAGGTPLETLIRLFILGVAIDRPAARGALAPMTLEQWLQLGLLEPHGSLVRATVQMRAYQDLLVAWDFSRATRGTLKPDYVMGISPSTLTLAGLTIRRDNRSALDLGTGSGFLAMMAAKHSQRVVATDKSPRAVAMTELNLRLNDITGVECLDGDLFEPVGDQRFDLIVSNPPFIISPDHLYLFLHSGLRGDEICRRIAREAPLHLEEGGYCQYMADWAILSGEDWQEQLGTWFEGTGCDVWVLKRGSQPVDHYATNWIETEGEGLDQFSGFFDKWMDYYQELGIEAIGSGLITMRRRTTGRNWFSSEDSPETMSYPGGDDVAQVFRNLDFLADHDDGAVLDARLRLSPGVRLDQEYEPAAEGWRLFSSLVRKQIGLHHVGTIDPFGAQLLGRCDGRTPVRDLLTELASTLQVDPQGVIAAGPGILRRLIEQRFLIPADD